MKEFVKIAFRKITRMLKNIKLESKDRIHVLTHFANYKWQELYAA